MSNQHERHGHHRLGQDHQHHLKGVKGRTHHAARSLHEEISQPLKVNLVTANRLRRAKKALLFLALAGIDFEITTSAAIFDTSHGDVFHELNPLAQGNFGAVALGGLLMQRMAPSIVLASLSLYLAERDKANVRFVGNGVLNGLPIVTTAVDIWNTVQVLPTLLGK